MLSDAAFCNYCNRLALPELGVNYLRTARLSGPTRKVVANGGNVVARYPSVKMRRVISAESHRVELALIYLMEYDSSVFEFHDQPPHIKLRYISRNGNEARVLHTPDFLVIHENGVGWVECKPVDRLEQLALSHPARYERAESGEWRCPPGEQVALDYGFFYRLWSPEERDHTLVRNFRFLHDFFVSNCPAAPAEIHYRLLSLVEIQPGIIVTELAQRAQLESLDPIYRLIAMGELFIDLEKQNLAEPHRARLFRSRAACRAYGFIQAETAASPESNPPPQSAPPPKRRPLIPRRNLPKIEEDPDEPGNPSLGKLNGAGKAALRSACPADLEVANQRFAALINPAASGVPDRTLRRWRTQYWKGEIHFGSGFIALIPFTKDRGNRESRLAEGIPELADETIEAQYVTGRSRTKSAAYRAFELACRERGWTCPSFRWFRHRVDKWFFLHATGTEAFHPPIRLKQPMRADVHGDRPWDVAHLDHYLCDVEVVCADTGVPLGNRGFLCSSTPIAGGFLGSGSHSIVPIIETASWWCATVSAEAIGCRTRSWLTVGKSSKANSLNL